MTIFIEKTIRIWNDQEGVYLLIQPNPDFPESGIEITTNSVKANEDWYGKVDFGFNSKDEVQKFAKALLEMAETIS